MAVACTLLTWRQLISPITDKRDRQVHHVGLECSIRLRERSQPAASRAARGQPTPAARGQPTPAACDQPAARGQPSSPRGQPSSPDREPAAARGQPTPGCQPAPAPCQPASPGCTCPSVLLWIVCRCAKSNHGQNYPLDLYDWDERVHTGGTVFGRLRVLLFRLWI